MAINTTVTSVRHENGYVDFGNVEITCRSLSRRVKSDPATAMVRSARCLIGSDLKKAVNLLLQAADLGNHEAIVGLVHLTEKKNVILPISQSVDALVNACLCKQKTAAADGDLAALREYGLTLNGLAAYAEETVTRKAREKEGMQAIRKAATEGNVKAMKDVARLTDSSEEALSFLQKAVDLGSSAALRQLGDKYSTNGQYQEAFRCFIRAAETGDCRSIGKIANAYWDGLGVLEDRTISIRLWERCVAKGCQVYLDSLAFAYHKGKGTSRDDARALDFWQKLSNRGSACATRDLAEAYRKGYGVKVDVARAEELEALADRQQEESSARTSITF